MLVDRSVRMPPSVTPRPLLHGYRVNTLLCLGFGLPLLVLLSSATVHAGSFARPLRDGTRRPYGLRPRVIRLDASYRDLKLIAWIHTALGAVVVIPGNAKRQKKRTCLPPRWTADELGKRTSSEHYFGRVFSLFCLFRLQRPPVVGWSVVTPASFSPTRPRSSSLWLPNMPVVPI